MSKLLRFGLLPCLVLLSQAVVAQQFLTAGPDKETCEGKSVQIGPPDTNPAFCYKWEPSTGLSCTDCPNPMATIHTESMEYTLKITDDDFSLNFSDAVKVTLNFGVITFDAQYVKQGSDEVVTATLQQYSGGVVDWSFEGDNLGCQINGTGQSAVITPGTRYGTLKVVAKLQSDMECMTMATIDVNVGVKDIIVVDEDKPGRKAMNGQTLHIITSSTNNNVVATAIPNDGETFMHPTPTWHTPHPNSVPVQNGQVSRTYDVPPHGSAAFTAGYGAPDYNPTTYVDAHPPAELPINGIPSITASFNEKINDVLAAAAKFPGSPVEFEFEMNLAGTELKLSDVEKYNDPAIGKKYEFNMVSSITVSGSICHPVLCKTIALPEILGGDEIASTEVSIGASGMLQISGGFVKDESMEDDSWKVNNEIQAQAVIGISATIGGSFNFGGYTLNGEAVGACEAGTVFTWDSTSPQYIKAKNFVVPLKLTFGLFLQNNSDPRDIIVLLPTQTYELIPKYEGMPFNLIDLSSYF